MTDSTPAPSPSGFTDRSAPSPDGATAMRKVDPETLTLRGAPAKVIRFRRGVIMGAGILVLFTVLAATWLALKPHRIRSGAGDDRQDMSTASSSDALAKAPTSYSDVPKLGPPLPGDLGKPIFDHQQTSPVTADDPTAQRARQTREQLAAEQKAARESGLLTQTAGHAETPDATASLSAANASSTPPNGSPEQPRSSLDLANDPNAQGHKAEFIATRDTDADVNPHALVKPVSRFMLSAGSVISASLVTGLRSDLPGLVVAQVTQNIYDSSTGSMLLLPQGARLIGSYDSVVAFGQRRALLVWQRIILPDGSSLRIDNVPATDASGYAGLADKVDFHTWTLLKGVVLSTLLGVGSDLALSGQGDLVQAIRMSTQDSVSRAGDQITQRNLQIQPTITIRPGATVELVVHRDLVLAPWIERSGQ